MALKPLKGKLEEGGLRELSVSGVHVQGQIKEPNPLTVKFSNLRNKFLNFPGSFCGEFEGRRKKECQSGAPCVSWELLTNPQVSEGKGPKCLAGGWDAGGWGRGVPLGWVGLGSYKQPRETNHSGETEASAMHRGTSLTAGRNATA